MDTTVETPREMLRLTNETKSFGQGNFEALVQASQIWFSGLQSLSQTMAAATQARMDLTTSTFKSLSGVKSLKEAADLQLAYAQNSLKAAFDESGKLTAALMALSEAAMAPLTERMSVAADKARQISH